MKKIVTLLSLFISSFTLTTNAQVNFMWAKGMGGTGFEAGQSITTDPLGNVFTTGFFNGPADFDPDAGVTTLTPKGSYDVFISKLDASGNFVWANNMGGGGNDFGQAITVDPAGKIVSTGYFEGTADFDPGTNQYNLISAGGNDIFISKLNQVGNFVWAKSMGGSGNDITNAITTDASGNVLTTGYFESTADFDPGGASYTLSASGLQDIFISKLDMNGNFLWAKAVGGASLDAGSSIVADAAGDVIVTGYFRGTVDFDPGPGTYTLASVGLDDIFILKLNPAGNFIWAKAMGGVGADGGNSITLDAVGKVYTFGYCDTIVDFDPGPGTYTIDIAGGIFISKLDGAGNFVWAQGIDAVDGSQSITSDAFGNIFTAGYFDGSVDFDPGPGVYTVTSTGGYDVFITKMDTTGNFILARTVGGPNGDGGNSITTDAAGNILTTGYFDTTGDYDPTGSVFNLTSAGFDDIFVLKLGNDVGIKEVFSKDNNSITIYPNPSNGIFQLSLNKKEKFPNSISVTDLLGRTILNDDKITSYNYNLDLGAIPNGMFVVKVNYSDRIVTKKITKN